MSQIEMNLDAVLSPEDKDTINGLLSKAISTAYDTSMKVEFDPQMEISGRTYTLRFFQEEDNG